MKRRSVSLPSDIKWHFIGHLQSNKAKGLVEIDNLYVIETVDSVKLAKVLNNACEKIDKKVNIFLQVLSSEEDTKSGIKPSEVIGIVETIMSDFTNLNLIGLMSIGQIGDLEGFQMMYDLKCRFYLDLTLWDANNIYL